MTEACCIVVLHQSMDEGRRVTALAPGALVVRAGQIRDPDVLIEKIQAGMERGEPCALSVFAMNPITGEEEADTIRRIVADAKFPHPKLQLSTVERLEAKQFALTWDTSNGQAQCHYNVILSNPLDRAQLEAFVSCFSEPQQRPEQE